MILLFKIKKYDIIKRILRMATDLSYVLENENDEYYRLRIGMKNDEIESMSFDRDFAVLKPDKHIKIFLFDNKEGLVARIHLKEENKKNNVQAMYTKPQHRKNGRHCYDFHFYFLLNFN